MDVALVVALIALAVALIALSDRTVVIDTEGERERLWTRLKRLFAVWVKQRGPDAAGTETPEVPKFADQWQKILEDGGGPRDAPTEEDNAGAEGQGPPKKLSPAEQWANMMLYDGKNQIDDGDVTEDEG